MISAGVEKDPRVANMKKKKNDQPGQGLEKDEQGNPKLSDFKGQGNSKGLGYKKVGLSKVARRRFFSMNNLFRNVRPLRIALLRKERESSTSVKRNLSRWLE